jgi:hypothetical protein
VPVVASLSAVIAAGADADADPSSSRGRFKVVSGESSSSSEESILFQPFSLLIYLPRSVIRNFSLHSKC